jgi:hypothetical protein
MARVVWAVLLIGCGGSGTSLSELPGLRVTLGTVGGGLHVDDARLPTPTIVTLGYHPSFRDEHDGECAEIGSNASASIDGTKLPLTDAGGATAFTGDDDCEAPMFEGQFVFESSTAHQIVVEDDSARVVGEYAAVALEPPFATLTSQAAWTFRAGDQLVFRWSRPLDLSPTLDATFSVRYQGEELGGDNHINLPIQVVDGDIHVQFPSPLPSAVTSPGTLMFRANTKSGPSLSCTGASACTYAIERDYWRKTELE